MDKQEIQNFIKDTIYLASQSTKRENSSFVSDIISKMDKTIKISVAEHINGKISQIKLMMENYIQSDNEWKEQANPVLDMGRNVQGFGKVSLYILGFFAAIAGAVFYIIDFLRK